MNYSSTVPRVRLLPSQPSENVPSVLLVDDRASGLRPLQKLLEREGVPVLSALNAESAIKVLETTPITVVVSDWIMPGGRDGMSLLDEVARRWAHVERLLITGHFHSDVVELANDSNHRAVSKTAVNVIVETVVWLHHKALARGIP